MAPLVWMQTRAHGTQKTLDFEVRVKRRWNSFLLVKASLYPCAALVFDHSNPDVVFSNDHVFNDCHMNARRPSLFGHVVMLVSSLHLLPDESITNVRSIGRRHNCKY